MCSCISGYGACIDGHMNIWSLYIAILMRGICMDSTAACLLHMGLARINDSMLRSESTCTARRQWIAF